MGFSRIPSNMNRKKKEILLITFYWPPAGGVSAQRWLKFVKYLVLHDYNITVVTADESHYPELDYSFDKDIPDTVDVHRVKMRDPRRIYKSIVRSEKKQGTKKDDLDRIFHIPPGERTFLQKLSLWVRANFFIPDARSPWIKPAIKKIMALASRTSFDFLITTGPPHSVHVVGLMVHRKTGVKWVADFRDPWLDIGYHEKMPMSQWADNRHRQLERQVVEEADGVIVVSDYWKKGYNKYNAKHIEVITNGYDEDDFKDLECSMSRDFLISHIGTLHADRNAPELWQVLNELLAEDDLFGQHLKFQILGNLDMGVLEELSQSSVKDHLDVRGFVSHPVAIKEMLTSSVLLLLVNRSDRNALGRMTSKIFEYLAARRPILLIGPIDSDPAKLLAQTKAGVSVAFDDKANLKKTLQIMFENYKNDDLCMVPERVEMYSRRRLTEQLISFIEKI